MARPKNTADIAPIIRGAFLRAVMALEDSRKPLSTLIMERLKEDPINTLKAMAAFMPRERNVTGKVQHEHDHKHEHTHVGIPETLAWVEEMLDGAEVSPPEKPRPH